MWRLGRGRILSGATLARVEGQEVFKALAERFPGFQVEADELDYSPASHSGR